MLIPKRWLALTMAVATSCGVCSAAIQAAAGDCRSQPHSNIGCEFYAVSLPNLILDQSMFPSGIAVQNSADVAIDVQVSGGSLSSPLARNISASEASTIAMSWVSALSISFATVKVIGGAYRVVSSGMASVVQLNPLQSVVGATSSASADASLLLVQSAGTAPRHDASCSSMDGGDPPHASHRSVEISESHDEGISD